MPISRDLDLRIKQQELVGKTLTARLYTASPTATSAGTEVTGGSYAPVSVTIGLDANNKAVNTAEVLFTGMPAATITTVAIFGTSEMLFYGNLSASLQVAAGDSVVFKAGAITVTID